MSGSEATSISVTGLEGAKAFVGDTETVVQAPAFAADTVAAVREGSFSSDSSMLTVDKLGLTGDTFDPTLGTPKRGALEISATLPKVTAPDPEAGGAVIQAPELGQQAANTASAASEVAPVKSTNNGEAPATQADIAAEAPAAAEPASEPVFDDAAKAKLEELQGKGDAITASERLAMNKLIESQKAGEAKAAADLAEGKAVSDLLQANATGNSDGRPFTDAQISNAQKYKDHLAKLTVGSQDEHEVEAVNGAGKLIPREQIARDKIARLDEAKKEWAKNTTGADTLARPEIAINLAKTGQKLDESQQKTYDKYVSDIEGKIEAGRTLTTREESDIRGHYDREIISGKSEMGQELADIGAQVNKEMAANGGKMTDETKERMAGWLSNLFGGNPDEAQKMLIEAVRKGPSERLLNLFASATPEKAMQVKERIADLAILEMRYKNADKMTNEIKHQAWDVREALQQLGTPPSPIDQSEDAFEKRNRFYALEMLLMQKKSEIVQQSYLGARLINEYNKAINEIKKISGERNWLMFQAAKIGGALGDLSIDVSIRAADIKGVEGSARPTTPREGDPLDLSKVGTGGRYERGNADALEALM